jgi:Ras-related protein Rab-5C
MPSAIQYDDQISFKSPRGMAVHKAVLMGDTNVGKTCLYHRITTNEFTEGHVPTVAGTFAKLDVKSQSGFLSQIGLWDTAGQERYKTVVPMYFDHAEFLLLTFSVNSRASFDSIQSWIDLAAERASPDAKKILIGNKADLEDQVEVDFQTLTEFGEQIGAYLTVQTSAKTGSGIDILLTALGDGCAAPGGCLTEPPAGAASSVQLGTAPPVKKSKGGCCG